MLHRTLARHIVENASTKEILCANFPQALVQRRFYSRKNIQDLIDQTIVENPSTSGSNVPPVSQQDGEKPFLERLKMRPSGRPLMVFGDELSQLATDAFEPPRNNRERPPNRRNVKTGRQRGSRTGTSHVPEDIVEAEIGRYQDSRRGRMEKGRNRDLEEEVLQEERGGGGEGEGGGGRPRPQTARKRTPKFDDTALTPEFATPQTNLNALRQKGGPRRGPKGKGRKALLLGEGEEEKVEVSEDFEANIGKEEFWDVDADSMRVLRQMMAWRNPVSADEPGDPALFHRTKGGYDVYAEGRTQFRLNDTSATWSTNGPTTSYPDMIGGQKGDYSTFMPEQTKQLANMDAASMKPADIVRFSLAGATDIPPKQRESVVASVENFLASAAAPQTRRA